MKKALIGLFVILAIGASLYAQESYMELVRADLKTQKVALITVNMALTDAQSQVFWPIYRKYDAEMTAVGDQVIALLKDYAANVDKMTDAKAAELMKQTFAVMDKRLKLLNKVCDELAKALDPVVAAKFMQCERQITAAVDLQLGSMVPLITKTK
jgi:hypothetical protein